MTDKEMNKFAEIVAEKVINKIKKNQEEWDKQFYEEFKEMESGVYIANKPELSERDKLKAELDKLREERSKLIDEEEYGLIPPIQDKITDLIEKLNYL